MRKLITLLGALALMSCGKSADDRPAESSAPNTAQAVAAPADAPAASIDPCSLVADTQALFGTPVTAGLSTTTGQKVCEWKSEDGRMCGSVTLFTPAYNSSPDPKVNFAAMVTSLGAFGEAKDVAGIGEEAKMVDAGMFGAQLALRTPASAALVASACRSGPHGQVEIAQRLAREVAGKL